MSVRMLLLDGGGLALVPVKHAILVLLPNYVNVHFCRDRQNYGACAMRSTAQFEMHSLAHRLVPLVVSGEQAHTHDCFTKGLVLFTFDHSLVLKVAHTDTVQMQLAYGEELTVL